VVLVVRANRAFYNFAWRGMDGEEHFLGAAETRYLSSEVAGGFTGVYFALYTCGSGAPAVFDWFDYQILETPGQLSIDSPLREVFADQQALAVLQRCLPALVEQPPSDWSANFSLVDLAGMSPDLITPQAILAADAGLRQLHVNNYLE
jgi:hypothetical protein